MNNKVSPVSADTLSHNFQTLDIPPHSQLTPDFTLGRLRKEDSTNFLVKLLKSFSQPNCYQR